MMATQKEQKSFLKRTQNTTNNDKHTESHVSLVKQHQLLVSTLNMIVKNHHATEENEDQCGRYQTTFWSK